MGVVVLCFAMTQAVGLAIYQSSDKSLHVGFAVAISCSFLILDQLLICFSLSIAAVTSVVVSK